MAKAVQDLIGLLEYAFQEGECTCGRCRLGGDQDLYNIPHNFEINGVIHSRKFAKSAREDLSTKLMSALKARYQEAFSDGQPLDEGLVKGMILEGDYERLCLLGKANGLIDRIDNGFIHIKKG